MTDETMTEETVNSSEETKAARKTYTYNGRKVSLKEYVMLIEAELQIANEMILHSSEKRQKTLKRLHAFFKATPMPPVEQRTDEWLEAFIGAMAEMNDLND